MTSIPLRLYCREIEGLIDGNQNDEAIAHCRHILKYYPKNIAVYRLLGKAYLESQRYGDAADIFLRVLSAAPDDFVAQVGMSIIREDEGNQDAAIWHMERAYEVQPYNAAIQDELRRLYGKRDGLEPPKVRMTRGALARMYGKGNLYQQAIGELRAALADDPQRPDLQVLLARMYFLSGQRVEAVETCSLLIKKFPYCLEANRLLAAILPETERKADTQIYAQRVMALDPYLSKAAPYSQNGDEVPDNTTVVERLEWKRGQIAPEPGTQPAWAKSLGVEIDHFAPKEELPDWLSPDSGGPSDSQPGVETGAPPTPAFGETDWNTQAGTPAPTASADQAEGDDKKHIPDWMKQAGWGPSSGTAVEGPAAINEPEESLSTPGEIAPANIPDWLRAIAPEGALDQSKESGDEGQEDTSMPWLDEKTPGPSDTIVTWLGENKGAPKKGEQTTPPAENENIPDWLRTLGDEGAEQRPSGEQPALPSQPVGEASLPDWLHSLEETDQPQEQAAPGQPAAVQPPQAEIPDWLNEMSATEATSTTPGDQLAQPDDWLKEFTQQPPAGETVETPAAAQAAPATEMPDWLKDMAAEPHAEIIPAAEPIPTELAALPGPELPDWLQEMPAEEAGEQPTSPQPAGSASWMEGISREAPAEQGAALSAAGAALELPDWLKEMQASEQPATLSETPSEPVPSSAEPKAEWPLEPAVSELPAQAETAAVPTNELPDWIKELGGQPAETQAEEQPAPIEETAVPAAELPDWLKEMASEQPAETPAPETPAPVEALAQPAAEVPDWLTELSAQPADSAPAKIQATEPPAPVEEATVPAAELPDWLKEMAPEQPAETPAPETPAPVEAQVQPAAELPDWLTELSAQPADSAPAKIQATEPPAPVEEAAVPAAELPDWLKEMAPEQPAETPAPVEAVEPPAVPAEPAAAPAMADLSNEQAALAWLESLAAKQGVPEEELITKPEERTQVPPEWAQEQPAAPVSEAQPVAEIPAAEPAQPAELPDWLKEMAPEQPAETPAPVEAVEPLAVPAEPAAAPAMADLSDEQAALAWLESLAAKQGVPEEELITKPEERTQVPPEWAQEQPAAPVSEAQPVAEIPATEPAQPAELPDWLKQMESEAAAVEEQPAPAAAVEPPAVPAEPAAAPAMADLSDEQAALAWLESLAAKQGVPEEELITKPEERTEVPPEWAQEQPAAPVSQAQPVAEIPAAEPAQPAELPDWLKQMQSEAVAVEEQPAPAAAVEPPTVPAEPAAAPAMADLSDEQAALAWLESLAAKQGVPEEELITKPEERTEVPPEWAQEQPAVPVSEAQPLAESPAAEPAQPAELPDWLKQMQSEAVAVEEQPAPVQTQPVSEAEQSPAAEQAAITSAQPDFTDEQAALAWLESLAAKQGVPEEELITKPGERREAPPEWAQTPLPAEAEAVEPTPVVQGYPEQPRVETPIEAPMLEQPAQVPQPEAPAEEIPVPVAEAPAAALVAAEELPSMPDLPAWLQDMETTKPAAVLAPVPEAGSAMPEWVAKATEEEKLRVPEIQTPVVKKIDLNTASLVELENLPGVGFIVAQKILAYREAHGAFTRVEDLTEGAGIHPAIFAEMRNRVTVSAPLPGRPVQASAPSQPTGVPAPAASEDDGLTQARNAMIQNKPDEAASQYEKLIKKSQQLDRVIQDLKDALYRYPVDVHLWQTLGDAYMRNHQLKDALEAYTKAEELLR